MKKITITVGDDGSTKVRTEGYAGKTCLQEVEKLHAGIKALGIKVENEKVTMTPEAMVATRDTTTISNR